MAINFNELPQEKPGFPLIPKGQYMATIAEADMKANKTDPTKAPYLALVLQLTDLEGNPRGKLFDNITESDNDYVRYKLKRFVEVMGLPLTGSLELKDLAKIAKGKRMLVDVTVDEKSDPPKSQVDIFSGDIYYPLETSPTENPPINAADAADAPQDESAPPATTY